MQTLQKLHLSNRLYIKQVTCHLLMLLLSARACSETAKRNSVSFEISFVRISSLIETSQLICVASWFTVFFCHAWSAGISPDFWVGSFSLGPQFLQIFGRVAREFAEIVLFFNFIYLLFIYLFILFFQRGFSRRGLGEVSVFCAA